MKNKEKMSGQILEAVLSIVIGLSFIIWPASILKWMVFFIGIISLIFGVIQLIGYFATRKNQPMVGFPLFGVLLLIWGILLLVQPHVWVNLFMVVLSIPMIIMSIGQIASLSKMKRSGYIVKGGYYIFPVLFLLAGVLVMFNPFSSAIWLITFVGIWVIAYGISDLINYFYIRK